MRVLLLFWVPLLWRADVPPSLPMSAPIIVSERLLTLSERRDSIVSQEARRFEVPWLIAYAVTHAENYSGNPEAISSAGAVGIMQIMPKHHEAYHEECYRGRVIVDMQRNACIGVNLLRDYREAEGSWGAALRRSLGFRHNIQAWMDYTDDIIDHMVALD